MSEKPHFPERQGFPDEELVGKTLRAYARMAILRKRGDVPAEFSPTAFSMTLGLLKAQHYVTEEEIVQLKEIVPRLLGDDSMHTQLIATRGDVAELLQDPAAQKLMGVDNGEA